MTRERGPALRVRDAAGREVRRDSALPDLSGSARSSGPLYKNPTGRNLFPRGFAWEFPSATRAPRCAAATGVLQHNNHQNMIVTVTIPVYAAAGHRRPTLTFPNPPFDRASAISMRPIQFDLDNPRVHIYNTTVQQELWGRTAVTVGYAGSRGRHLLRSGDVNLAQPTGTTADGRVFIAANTPRINPAFSTIELKSSDGDSWYNAFIFEVRRRWSQGLSLHSSYTFSKSEDTTQASTFFSDGTNGTTSALPEFVADYNSGRRFRRPPTGGDFTWALAGPARDRRPRGAAGRLERLGDLDGEQRQSSDGVREHQPVALAVNRRRPRHRRIANYAPATDRRCRARRIPWFIPPFVLQRRDFRQSGRGISSAQLRPRSGLSKTAGWSRLGGRSSPLEALTF